MRTAQNGSPIPKVGDTVNCYDNKRHMDLGIRHCTMVVEDVDIEDNAYVLIRGTATDGKYRLFYYGGNCYIDIVSSDDDNEEERNTL